jgi:hypothetical protein
VIGVRQSDLSGSLNALQDPASAGFLFMAVLRKYWIRDELTPLRDRPRAVA